MREKIEDSIIILWCTIMLNEVFDCREKYNDMTWEITTKV